MPFNYKYGSDGWQNTERQRLSSNSQISKNPAGKSLLNFGVFAGGLAGAHTLLKINQGRGYDYLVKGLRTAEEYSPGNFLRTFQASNFFSQFTSVARQTRYITPEVLMDSANKGTYEYLVKLLGEEAATTHLMLNGGLTFKGGKLYFGSPGQLGDIALKHASIVQNPLWSDYAKPSANYSLAYARSLGVNASGDAFSRALVEGDKYGIQVLGGKNIFQHMYRQASAMGTEGVGRFNRLLQAPAELPPFAQAFNLLKRTTEKIPLVRDLFRYGLGVKPGGGLNTLGRLVGKWGVIGTLGYLGYQEVDRRMRNAKSLDNTSFDQGLTAGIAGMGVNANLNITRVSESLGLQTYREKQEQIAPGSTNLFKLAAFPIMGTLGASVGMYGAKVFKTAQYQLRNKLPLEEAANLARRDLFSFAEKGLFSSLHNKLGKYSRVIAEMKPTGFARLLGGAAGLALILPFVPGALIPDKRTKELEDLYSGQKEVTIKAGRWWEMGRQDFEGGRITRFQKHWYPRLLARSKEKTLWGDDADKMSSLEKYYKKEFTYYLENKQTAGYKFPQSSLPLEDVPLIGPLLANTIGRFIKPPKLMNIDEWTAKDEEGNRGAIATPLKYGQEFHPELGELAPGIPESPYDIKATLREQAYRMSEMVGLPGYIATVIKSKVTGSEDLYSDRTELESFRRAHGAEREYWDKELGGILGLSEFFRRLYPHKINSLDLYNPIDSGAPSWLPGSGERSPDFQHGSYFTKVPLGEERLPGPGYQQLNPELKGIDPENYPLIQRYKILSDVAMWSDQFKETARAVNKMRKTKDWGEYEENIFQQTAAQVAEKKESKDFSDYQYLAPYGKVENEGTTQAKILAAINKVQANGKPDQGIIGKIFGGYWEWLSHNAELSAEQLTPIAPAAKLLHERTAIEDYERSQLAGSDAAFWNRPYENFLRPFLSSAGRGLGWKGIPSEVQEKRNTEEYFDILKYVKYQRLSLEAKQQGDVELAAQYTTESHKTLTGVNPYTQSIGLMFSAMPRHERDYFTEFKGAQTAAERQSILEKVPDQMKPLYQAQWQMEYWKNTEQAIKRSMIPEELAQEATQELAQINKMRATEGMPANEALLGEYYESKLPGENYPDWYRRNYIIPKRLEELGAQIPNPDWVGFNPAVDLEDVKLKYVQNAGMDMHNFNLWKDRENALVYKPFIDKDTINEIKRGHYNESDIKNRLDQLFNARQIHGKHSMLETNTTNGRNSITINMDYDRKEEVKQIIRSNR